MTYISCKYIGSRAAYDLLPYNLHDMSLTICPLIIIIHMITMHCLLRIQRSVWDIVICCHISFEAHPGYVLSSPWKLCVALWHTISQIASHGLCRLFAWLAVWAIYDTSLLLPQKPNNEYVYYIQLICPTLFIFCELLINMANMAILCEKCQNYIKFETLAIAMDEVRFLFKYALFITQWLDSQTIVQLCWV